MLLHTVNKSPFDRNSLESCLGHAKSGSGVIMIEDAVYGAIQGTAAEEAVKKALGEIKVYALAPDLKARGLPEDKLIDGVTLVDYAGFVDLAAEHDVVQAWL